VKFPLIVGLAALGLALTLAAPKLGGGCDRRGHARPGMDGTPVDCDTFSGRPCRLVVRPGPDTVVDRGHLGVLSAPREVTGSYRYQQEREHRVLYVYDELQNLVGRVVDPGAVVLREALP